MAVERLGMVAESCGEDLRFCHLLWGHVSPERVSLFDGLALIGRGAVGVNFSYLNPTRTNSLTVSLSIVKMR